MTSSAPPSKPPTPPRLRSTDLPLDDTGMSQQPGISAETDLSTLSSAQLYDLNQELLNDSVPDRPLIDGLSPMSALRSEYENGSATFVKQIDGLLESGFTSLRRTKGDGDCFYRSLAFAYVDQILFSPDSTLAASTAISYLESTLSLLGDVGFHSLIYDDFFEVFSALIENVYKPDAVGEILTRESLLEAFQTPEKSNSIVMYLRLLTSAQIRSDPDTYAPFLMNPDFALPMETREFCEQFVDACGKEADHVQITALARVLKTSIKIAYLDGRSPVADFVEFSNEDAAPEPICLLYRPGHYDILSRD